MAITLDELLGMNTTKSQDEVTYDSFPQYDQYNDYRNGRGRTVRADGGERRFNGYTVVQNGSPRSEESIRSYEASRPYEIPRNSEYQSGADRGFEQMRRRSEAPVRNSSDYGYKEYASFAPVETRENSLHDFARKDNDRPSDRELFDRLSASSAMTATPSARVEENYEKTSTFAPAKKTYKSESSKKARLNTKAKVLLAVYFAVIILVAVLIIVNAGNLNNGTATTPSSSITGVVQDSAVASHISDASSIDFDYGASFLIK